MYLLLPMNVLSLGNFFIIALILLHEIYSRFIFCFNSRKLRLNFDHISKYESLNIKPNFQKFYPNVREGNREVNFHVIASPNVLVKIQKELFTHRKRLYGSQLSWFRILMCGCAAQSYRIVGIYQASKDKWWCNFLLVFFFRCFSKLIKRTKFKGIGVSVICSLYPLFLQTFYHKPCDL